jgi:myosin heavy subunit
VFWTIYTTIIAGNIQTFILEKSRVVEHRKDEKNFHVFHAFFAGLQLAQLQELYLSDKPNDYR